ncbi:MAG: CBS domain-containing protein [Gammaproteobacteria bacterium]|nr:CBS domain-containing protein [Gammaproteobacteria bacterium]
MLIQSKGRGDVKMARRRRDIDSGLMYQTSFYSQRAGDYMATGVVSLTVQASCLEAVDAMRAQGASSIVVIDSIGRPVGIVTEQDVLRKVTFHLGEDTPITHVMSSPLRSIGEDDLLFQGIARMRRHALRHMPVLNGRGHMAADDWGEPPINFEVVVMGSGGRGESFLGPDQDNGLILDDYPDSDHDRIDRWFYEFACRMTASLDAIGFPFCKGHVMATNPLWRKSVSQWRDQIAFWVQQRKPKTMLLCDIFFDFSCVYGSGIMTGRLRDSVTEAVQHPGFLGALCLADQSHDVGLDWLGRLESESEPGPNKGKLNLKMLGILPIVGSSRLMSLREGIRESGTVARLNALFEKDVISRDEHAELVSAVRLLTDLLLGQQLRDVVGDKPVTKHVDPRGLSRLDREHLKEAFKNIRSFRAKVRSELTGTLIG